MYYQDAAAAVIVYDTTFRESFESAKNWVEDLKQNANVQDLVIAIVGNKCDLTDKTEVNFEEAHQFAKMIKAEVIKETSAKDNQGIDDLFNEIGTKLYRKHKAENASVS